MASVVWPGRFAPVSHTIRQLPQASAGCNELGMLWCGPGAKRLGHTITSRERRRREDRKYCEHGRADVQSWGRHS